MSSTIIPDRDKDGRVVQRQLPFTSTDGLKFRGTGKCRGSIPAGTEDYVQYKLTENRFLNGVELFLRNQQWDDTLCLQVVDVDGLLAPAGTVLDQFGEDWEIATDCERQGPYILPYPALVYSGLYIRILYKSTGGTDVDLKANNFLHRKPV